MFTTDIETTLATIRADLGEDWHYSRTLETIRIYENSTGDEIEEDQNGNIKLLDEYGYEQDYNHAVDVVRENREKEAWGHP